MTVWRLRLVILMAAACASLLVPVGASAQDADGLSDAERRAAEALAAEPEPEPAAPQTGLPTEKVPEINLLELFVAGGWLMAPIVVMSLVVAVFGLERVMALRRRKVIPDELVEALGETASGEKGLDPRKVYKVCQQFPSAAAAVIRAAMLKVGRPHAEVEHTVQEASEREADRLYARVRPLTLAAAVTPLLGLLGTVWGMIVAFSKTATGNIQANKAEELAGGIYTALVTTFAGLAVAIPAAILAHWLEGRIQSFFREIDELLLNMLPQLERYEGKLRIHRKPGKPEPPSRRELAREGDEAAEEVEPVAGPK